ncbi:DELTA-thalatoxin-Avl1a-like [Erpetoichthys calabaricus]|uniref:DELTA-thalatoxin-Avl1a-like n=1 Tax=Erpetoichthys calabaricus TaxID=27687 RepID=A0A8C4SCL8_ERPCA|nr:DELTA-thalatoxin-Avl1a-like [Erpetoichthys calabaricus]
MAQQKFKLTDPILSHAAENISKTTDSSRTVTIQISNYSGNFILRNPRYYILSGLNISPPPTIIEQDMAAVMTFVKTPLVPRGCVGLLTYEIFEERERKATRSLAAMFSNPFDYNLYNIWFAVGFAFADEDCDENLFNEMYHEEGDGRFSRAKASNEISHTACNVEIKAKMTALPNSVLKIEVHDLY